MTNETLFMQEELARLGSLEVPADILALAGEIGAKGLQLIAANDEFVQGRVVIEQLGFDNDSTSVSEIVKVGLIESGTISINQAKIIERAAPHLRKLIAEHIKETDADDESETIDESYNDMADYLHASYATARGEGLPREIRRTTTRDKTLVDFFDFCVSSSTKPELISPAKLKPLLQNTIARAEPLKSDKAIPEDIFHYTEDTDIDFLYALVVADLFKVVKKLPFEQPEKKSNSELKGQTDDKKQEVWTMMLLADIENGAEFKSCLDDLIFRPHTKGLLRRKLSPEHEDIRQHTLGIVRNWKDLNRYEASQELIIASAAVKKNELLGEYIDPFLEKQRLYDESRTAFIDGVNERYSQVTDQNKLVVLLGLERFLVSTRYNANDVRTREAAVQNAKNHAYINALHLDNQLSELNSAAEPLRSTLDHFNTRYKISADQIRNQLAGGLQLRQLVLSWRQNGSNKQIFNRDEAQQLAGLAILLKTNSQLRNDFTPDVRAAMDAWSGLDFLHAPDLTRGLLLSSLDTLAEMYEVSTESQRNSVDFAPLWNLVRLSQEMPYFELEPEAVEIPIEEVIPEVTPEPVEPEIPEVPPEPPVPKEELHPALAILEQIDGIENIKAFPPDFGAKELIEDFKVRSKGWKGIRREWERLTSLVQLRDDFKARGFETRLLLLEQSEWHPLPHYVIEARQGNQVVAIVESPIYRNATYVVPSADWREIVQLKKEDAVKFGAIQKVHAAGSTAFEHRESLMSTALVGIHLSAMLGK